MSSLLNSTQNTRLLPTDSFRYIRSDMPNHLSESEIQWLMQNNVLTIVDLRTPAEVEKKACPLASRSEFHYLNIPVTGGNIVPPAPSQVANSYLNMVDNTMWQIIAVIENAKTNVLYFCNAGKDRTGVVSALLLSRMHIDRKTIIDDYMQSADNLREMLQAYAIENPMADINVMTPQASYMEDFLNRLVSERRIGKIKIITICGSMKFAEQMKQIAWKLEAEKGASVIQCVYNEQKQYITDEMQECLAAAHYRKIDICDAVYIVDIEGYIGKSVADEIIYAKEKGKEIIFHSEQF